MAPPCLQRIKVNREKLRILLLLWFLLCGGGALGIAKYNAKKTTASAKISTAAVNVLVPDHEPSGSRSVIICTDPYPAQDPSINK